MATGNNYHLLLLLLFLVPPPSLGQQSCTSLTFSKNHLFSSCNDLPHLSAALHWTYDRSNSTLSLAFLAPLAKHAAGWVAWGINPTATGMVGAQTLITFRMPDGSLAVNTFNITAYGPVKPSAIAFETWGLEAEENGGSIGIFAAVKLPTGLTKVNQVWQVGPMGPGGAIGRHEFHAENLGAVGILDVVNGQSSGTAGDPLSRERNIHGVLNALSWGLLLPIGGMVARWLKAYKPTTSTWFYLHVSCQLIGYAVGVAGWATGLDLGSQSKGIQYTAHRNIGITLFSLATLQVSALLLRPKKDHKHRSYWNAYHHIVGYVVIGLGVFNVFKGLRILNPDTKWTYTYIAVISSLALIALLLEVGSWMMSKSEDSEKPHDAVAGQRRVADQKQPLPI